MRPPSKAAQKLNHSGKCKCINTRTSKKLYFECGSSSYSRVCFLQLGDSIWVRISRKCTYNLCTSIYVQQEYSLGIITVSIKFINFVQQRHNQQNIDHHHRIGHHHHYQPEWDPNDPDSRTSEVGNATGRAMKTNTFATFHFHFHFPLSYVKNKKE